MVNLVTVYNNVVSNDSIKMISGSTMLEMSILAVSFNSNNERLLETYESLVNSLRERDMSEAIENIGIALSATYDNARIMIDMFNRIIREGNLFFTEDQVDCNG